jgi:hypothetical protein
MPLNYQELSARRSRQLVVLAAAGIWGLLLALSANAASQRGGLAVRAIATPPGLEGSGPWAWKKIQRADLSLVESALLRADTLVPLLILATLATVLLVVGHKAQWSGEWWRSATTPVSVMLVALAFSGWIGSSLTRMVIEPPVEAGTTTVVVEVGWLAAAFIWHTLATRPRSDIGAWDASLSQR